MTKAIDINGITGEVVERDMSDEEIEVQKQLVKKHATLTKLQANKVAARQAVLDKLGLTSDEAAALLG
jgi:paraquat-inducible protein B